MVAAAILDRLMHNAVVFNIKGPSWRMREHHALEEAATDPKSSSEGGAANLSPRGTGISSPRLSLIAKRDIH